jgi:hypothetical protein
MNQEDTHPGAELSRLLIAADSCVDPHRLVGLCWELAAAEPPMPRRARSSCRRSLAPSRSAPSAPSPSWSKPPGFCSRFAYCTPQRAAPRRCPRYE